MSYYKSFAAQHFGTHMTDADWRVEVAEWIKGHPTEAGDELAQHLDDELVQKLLTAPAAFAQDCFGILCSHIILQAMKAQEDL